MLCNILIRPATPKSFGSETKTNSDICDYSLIALGALAMTVFVVGGIRSQATTRKRLSKTIAGITRSILAGYSWILLSGAIGFTIIGADWSGQSDTWI